MSTFAPSPTKRDRCNSSAVDDIDPDDYRQLMAQGRRLLETVQCSNVKQNVWSAEMKRCYKVEKTGCGKRRDNGGDAAAEDDDDVRSMTNPGFSQWLVRQNDALSVTDKDIRNWFHLENLAIKTPFAAVVPCPRKMNDKGLQLMEGIMNGFGFPRFYVQTIPINAPLSDISRAFVNSPAHVPEEQRASRSDLGPLSYVGTPCHAGADAIELIDHTSALQEAVHRTSVLLLNDYCPRVPVCMRVLVVAGKCVAAEVACDEAYTPLFGVTPLSADNDDGPSGRAAQRQQAKRQADRQRAKARRALTTDEVVETATDVLAFGIDHFVETSLGEVLGARSYEAIVLAEVKGFDPRVLGPGPAQPPFWPRVGAEPLDERASPFTESGLRFYLVNVDEPNTRDFQVFTPEELRVISGYIHRQGDREGVALPPVLRFLDGRAEAPVLCSRDDDETMSSITVSTNLRAAERAAERRRVRRRGGGNGEPQDRPRRSHSLRHGHDDGYHNHHRRDIHHSHDRGREGEREKTHRPPVEKPEKAVPASKEMKPKPFNTTHAPAPAAPASNGYHRGDRNHNKDREPSETTSTAMTASSRLPSRLSSFHEGSQPATNATPVGCRESIYTEERPAHMHPQQSQQQPSRAVNKDPHRSSRDADLESSRSSRLPDRQSSVRRGSQAGSDTLDVQSTRSSLPPRRVSHVRRLAGGPIREVPSPVLSSEAHRPPHDSRSAEKTATTPSPAAASATPSERDGRSPAKAPRQHGESAASAGPLAHHADPCLSSSSVPGSRHNVCDAHSDTSGAASLVSSSNHPRVPHVEALASRTLEQDAVHDLESISASGLRESTGGAGSQPPASEQLDLYRDPAEEDAPSRAAPDSVNSHRASSRRDAPSSTRGSEYVDVEPHYGSSYPGVEQPDIEDDVYDENLYDDGDATGSSISSANRRQQSRQQGGSHGPSSTAGSSNVQARPTVGRAPSAAMSDAETASRTPITAELNEASHTPSTRSRRSGAASSAPSRHSSRLAGASVPAHERFESGSNAPNNAVAVWSPSTSRFSSARATPMVRELRRGTQRPLPDTEEDSSATPSPSAAIALANSVGESTYMPPDSSAFRSAQSSSYTTPDSRALPSEMMQSIPDQATTPATTVRNTSAPATARDLNCGDDRQRDGSGSETSSTATGSRYGGGAYPDSGPQHPLQPAEDQELLDDTRCDSGTEEEDAAAPDLEDDHSTQPGESVAALEAADDSDDHISEKYYNNPELGDEQEDVDVDTDMYAVIADAREKRGVLPYADAASSMAPSAMEMVPSEYLASCREAEELGPDATVASSEPAEPEDALMGVGDTTVEPDGAVYCEEATGDGEVPGVESFQQATGDTKEGSQCRTVTDAAHAENSIGLPVEEGAEVAQGECEERPAGEHPEAIEDRPTDAATSPLERDTQDARVGSDAAPAAASVDDELRRARLMALSAVVTAQAALDVIVKASKKAASK